MIVFFRILLIVILVFSTSSVYSNERKENIAETSYITKGSSIDVSEIDKKLLESLSAEEKKWYNKFQDGLMFFSGWQKISEEILMALPPEKKPHTKNLLEKLGVRIGAEWSKANEIRKIDTDQLRTWGKRLRKARDKGARHLTDTIKIIATEVDAILAQEMD